MTTRIKNHMYIIPGVVDGAAAMAKAEFRRDHRNEATLVHAHGFVKGKNICTEDCRVLEPGFETRSIACERVPMEEEKY